MIGHWEWVIIFLVILLVFGARRIPEIAQGLGKGIREFRKAMHEVQDEIDVNRPVPPAARQIAAAETSPAGAAGPAAAAGPAEPVPPQPARSSGPSAPPSA